MRVIVLLLCALLSGCASFGPPTLEQQLKEQQACTESWACRTFISDRPVVLVASIKNTTEETKCALDSYGIKNHHNGKFIVAYVNNREYAIDSSWTCPDICSVREAEHGSR